MNESNGMVRKVQALFLSKLHIEVPSPETDLFEEGLLDSLRLVDVLLHIEQEFSVEVSLEDRVAHIVSILDARDGITFTELFDEDLRRTSIVVTLMAILELACSGRVYLRQAAPRGEIWARIGPVG